MIDTDKYEDAKKMVQDAELIDENDGHPDIHYRKIADLLAEVKRLREENKRHLSFWEYDWDAMAEIERQMRDEEE